MNSSVEHHSTIDINAAPWVDLRTYDQSSYNRGRPKWFVLLWWLVQAITFPLSLHNFNSFRCWLLKLFGAQLGTGVLIRPTARITYPWKLEVGDHSWIGDDVVLYSLEPIRIGSHCVISQECYLCTGSHYISTRNFCLTTAPITLGNGVWLASDCFIAPGVTIGSNTVVGARSSVFKDIPAAQVAFGSPCLVRYPRKMQESVSEIINKKTS